MSLEASSLTIQVISQGIADATKALNDLAKAGENAEKKTSNIGSGAKASAKAQVDAAQQAASSYNAIIDMMTEKSNTFYSDKALKAATASQQELFDGMSMMDKLWAYADEMRQKDAAARAQQAEDIRSKQAQQLADATAASEKALAQQFDAFQKQKAMEAGAQAKGDTLNQAGQRAADYKKIQDAAKALAEETKKLAAAEKAEQLQREAIDMQAQKQRWRDEAAAVREATAAKMAEEKIEQQLKADGEAFTSMLKRRAETIGMSHQQLRDYSAEQLRTQATQYGLMKAGSDSEKQINSYINAIRNAKGAHEGFSFATAGSARELMVLGHELATGSMNRFYGSLIVLGERVNLLPAIFRGVSNAAAGMGTSFGLLLGGITAAVTVVGTFLYALSRGAQEQREFNKALILSGNYAGMTADGMEQMAQAVGNSTGSFGAAKANIVALAESGKFTSQQIGLISEAITAMQHATGDSGEKMRGEFEKLATLAITSSKRSYDEISRHVMELNDKYHFLTLGQYAQIEALDKQGQSQEAANMAEEAYANKMKDRAEQINENLGTLQKGWRAVAEAASAGWDAMLNMGKKDTLQDSIDRYVQELNHMNSMPGWWSGNGQGGSQQKQFDEGRKRVVDALTAALLEQKKQQDAANKAGEDQQKIQAGIHAMARTNATEVTVSRQSALDKALAEEKVNNELAKQAIALELLSDNEKVVADARKASAKYTDEAIAKRNKDITDYYTKKQPKPHTEGMSGLDKNINEINEEYEVQKRAMDNQIKLIDFKNKYGLMADEDAQSEKEKLLDDELKLEKDHLQKALDAIDSFHTKDIRLANDAASKRANIQKQLAKVMSDIEIKGEMNDLVPDVNFAAEQTKQQKEQDTILKQIEKQTKSVQAQVDAYNKLPDAVKAVGVRQKEMASEVEQAKIDSLQAEKDSLQSNDLIEQAMNKRRIDQIDKEIEARKKLKVVDAAKEANDQQNNAALNRSSALTKIATEQVKMWKDTGNEIEKALTSAFGSAGNAAGKMFKAFAEGQASQIDLADKVQQVKAKDGLSDAERTKQITALQDQAAQTQIGAYASMSDAASGFFDKQSQGYKIATTVSKAFHLAETAMALASIPAKLAAGAATMFAQSGWGGFAGVAAMTAAVAAFGVAITGGGGGSMSAADQQKIQGTGTVLGSQTITDGTKVILVGEKSNSIANSLKIAEKTSGLGLAVQNDMLTQLMVLNNNISGFAKLVVQNSGLTGVTASNSQSFSGSAIKTIGAIGGAFAGGAVGAAIGTALLPGLGTVIGGALGNLVGAVLGHGVVGKALSSIFGGSKSVDDTGLTIGRTSLGQVESSGLIGNQYTNTTTKGGWFRSDKHNTDIQSLGSEFNDQITKVVLSMETTLKLAANSLGMGGSAFDEKLKNFVVDIGNISLKGMTGDQIQTTLQNVFSKLGDQMAQFAFSDLTKYQKIGEGLMETVVRVANDLMQVNDVFKVLGKTMPQAAAGIAQAEKLVDSFGSSDALTKAVKSYQDAIYTDNEKLAPVVKSVQDSLVSMGLSSVKTKEDFKLVVDSLDLTSDSGVALFNKLMALAPTFGSAIDGLAKVNDTTKSSIQSVIDKLKQFSDNIHKFRDGLVLSASSPLTPQQQLAAAASQFETTIKKAMAGDENAQGHVTDIAQSYLDAARTMFASSDSYTAIFQKVEDELAKVQDFADGGVSDAQKQLDTMTNQLTSLNTLNGTATDILNSLNNLVNGASPASTATNSNATNAELLQTLKTLVGTVQQSDANNVNALQNNAAATYDSQYAAGKAIGEVIKAVVKTTKTGELYQTVER